MPLKEGIYRPASLLLLARAVGDQTRASALRQRSRWRSSSASGASSRRYLPAPPSGSTRPCARPSASL